jgi:hypothetical protein
MRVEFYKGGEPLEDWTRPTLQFVDDAGYKSSLAPVNLPPRVAVTRTFSVIAGRDDKRRALATADRAEFVASIIGAGEKREELSPPW